NATIGQPRPPGVGLRHAAAVFGKECRSERFLVDFLGDIFHVAERELFLPGKETGQKQTVTQRVDAPWNTAAGYENRHVGRTVEQRSTGVACTLQAVLDIRL